MNSAFKRALPPLIGIALFSIAIGVLHHALAAYRYQDIIAALRAIPYWQIALALALTGLGYIVLIPYDLLALKYIGRSLPLKKAGFTAAVSYAFSSTIGLSILTSGSVRYRLYSSWGLSSLEVAKVVVFCALTLWLGLLTLGGAVLILEPLALPPLLRLPFADGRPLGFIMLTLVAAYLLFSLLRRRPLQLFNIVLDVPPPRLALLQALVGALDWAMVGTILYVLLPPLEVDYGRFLAIFLIAQTAGLASHIPGGVGVFESLILLMLPGEGAAAGVAGALIAYRLIYYLLPLALAVLGLGLYESRHHTRRVLAELPSAVGAWIPALLPQVLALMALISGAVLLFSGAIPAVAARLERLAPVLPLPLLELAHLGGSLAGLGLILLARGLQHQLDSAWRLAVLLLGIGIAASLLKGLDYEEALVLTVLLVGLLPARPLFYRHTALLDEPLTAGWITTLSVILICTLWLGLFSYKHVDYTPDLWWRFSFLQGDAPRFLRAMLAVGVLTLGFAWLKWRHPAPTESIPPGTLEVRRAQALIAASPRGYAYLALLGDKTLLFNRDHTAFLMYGVAGRVWLAMGDPIAFTERDRRELAWEFCELGERHGAWTAFYQVHPDHLELYIELGLTLLKIGEEIRVPLAAFSLEGATGRGPRRLIEHCTRQDYRFEMIEPAAVAAPLLAEIKAVGDAWPSLPDGRETGFSGGFFNEHYLRCCPLAVLRRARRMVAFANLWPGAERQELAIDLLRHLPDTPAHALDCLLIEALRWGQIQGYRWFNLGMVPSVELEQRNASGVFARGQRFYTLQDLPPYLQKLAPQRQPRYLAAPGGIALPRVLAGLTALITGKPDPRR